MRPLDVDIRRAEVTSTSPLRVRRAGERLAVPAVETNVVVNIFDDVLVATIERQVYILVRVILDPGGGGGPGGSDGFGQQAFGTSGFGGA